MSPSRDPLVRLSEAVAAFLEFETGAAAKDEVLANNPELRDLLEPMFVDYETEVSAETMATGSAVGGSEDGTGPRRATREFLGDYRLVREIGRGGMGVVYEAEETSLGRRIALKVLPPNLTNTPKQIERFRREAAAAARLEHEGIVPIYSVGEAEGSHFFAMELVDGPSLHRVLQRLREEGHDFTNGFGTADLGTKDAGGYVHQVVEVVAAAAEAMAAAHSGGVIHRDLKPHNLLLNHEGRARVVDFGLAKDLARATMSQSAEVAGTPHYMSPEQIGGMRDVDHRTDIYALGVVLYELLTLRCPFDSASTQGLMLRITSQEAPPLRKVNARVPRELEIICHRAIEKLADDRYQTAAEFAADLRRFQAHEPIVARPPSAGSRLFKLMRRRRAAAVAVVLAALIPIGGTVFYFGFYAPESRRRKVALRQQKAEEERHKEAFLATHKLLQQQFGRVLKFLEQPGMRQTADEILQQSVATMESLDVDRSQYPNHVYRLAECKLQLAKLRVEFGRTDVALRDAKEARADVEWLCREFPQRFTYDWLRTQSELFILFLRSQTGDRDGVEADIREVLAAIEDLRPRASGPSLDQLQRNTVHARLVLATVVGEDPHRQREAIHEVTAALEQIESAPPPFRSNPDVRALRVDGLHFLAQLHKVRGELTQARSVLVAAKKECEALGDRMTARPDHASVLKTLAETYDALRDPSQAKAAWRESVAIFAAILEDFPDDATTKRSIARVWRSLANRLGEERDYPAAREAIEQAVRYAEQLPDGDGSLLIDRATKASVAASCALIRSMQMTKAEFETVDAMFVAAADQYRSLAQDQPADSSANYSLALCLQNHAGMCMKLGAIDRCRRLIDEALQHQERAVRGQPKNAKYLRILSRQYQLRTVVALREKDYEAAADSVGRAARSREADLRFRQWSASVLIRCMGLARADAGLSPAERDELTRRFGARAVAQIRYAVDSGVPKTTLQKDPGLRALHSHPDWQKLFPKTP